ncbi:MAG TPA: hypothetical protein VLC94_00925 [Candidatus Acidoferrum sp.]|nr:hypothetical protein [Candidatus Acidoferrum sp.]
MPFRRVWVWLALIGFWTGAPLARAQDVASEKSSVQANLETAKLVEELRAHEARIKELEEKLAQLMASKSEEKAKESTPPPAAPAAEANAEAIPVPVTQPAPEPPAEHEHTVRMPGGGPELKIRGFADFNLGFGSAANSLIFPLPTPVHNTFQAGEFDLFLSSRLSKKVSFVSEIIYGSDPTNEWGLDIERFQLTYKASPYFQISGGRFHTSIGYYNTAFHHGTWFQTATGRPFMYYFEDSGGLLPVHGVGISATGLVPGTGRLELHWIAEASNGRASDRNLSPVQNFLSDRNRKAVNVAAYIKPQWLSGLQVGGSYYHDRLVPPGITHVNQDISSLYAVFNNGSWEILGEGVLLSNEADGTGKRFNSPLTYAQISRKFGQYRPYFRYQYLNVPNNDPVNVFTGRYDGPSFGLRMDFTEYAALKAQYNRIYLRDATALNGVDLQVAFTF